MVGVGGGFLQSGVRRDHFARDQILPDVEMFERPLRLRSPQLAVRHIDFTEAVGFFANARYLHIADCPHRFLPSASVYNYSYGITSCFMMCHLAKGDKSH